MKNLLIYIGPTKWFTKEHGELTQIQIDNSLELGWKPEDILLVTNFPYEYKGVKSYVVGDECYYSKNKFNRSSKIPAIIRLFDAGMINEMVWFHDHDAFQLEEIKEEDLGLDGVDAGFTDHGWRAKWNAGSFFFNKGSRDIFVAILNTMNEKDIDEQDALTFLWENNFDTFGNRFKLINITYNIGIYYIKKIYEMATKPIMVAHFHPHKQRHLDLFLGKNELNLPIINSRLERIFNEHGIRTENS